MFCLPLGPQHKLWGKGVTFDIYTLALLNFERRMVWGYSSWCQIAQAPALADDDSHVRRDDGHEGDGEGSDGERDDMSVETASTEEDGDSSSEPGSENGEVAECISSSDEKTSSMPGGYDGPTHPCLWLDLLPKPISMSSVTTSWVAILLQIPSLHVNLVMSPPAAQPCQQHPKMQSWAVKRRCALFGASTRRENFISICLSIYLFTYLSISLSLFACLSACLSACLPACLPRLFVSQFLNVSLPARLSV